MPRSFFEILAEKKNNLYYKTQDEFDRKASALTLNFINFLGQIESVKASSVFASEGLENIEKDIRKDLVELRKFDSDKDKYRWNDPSVQEKIEEFEKKLNKAIDDSENIQKKINDEKIELLGDNGSLRIANTFFETAESLTAKGNQKIFAIASLDDKETKSRKRRQNTDVMEIAVFDSKLADITAKKGEGVVRKTGETDDDFKKRQDAQTKERDESVARFKEGIFQYAAGCLGESSAEIKAKWNKGNTGEDVKYRNELLIKIIPYLESITDKNYAVAKKGDPFGDRQFMADLEILARYTPNYSNYEYKDGGASIVITDADRKKIEIYMVGEDGKGGMKGKLKAKITEIKKNNSGATPKQKKMTEEMDSAESELEKVKGGDACDIESRNLLDSAKADMNSKIEQYKQYLTDKDKADMEEISKLIGQIESYCTSEKYREKPPEK